MIQIKNLAGEVIHEVDSDTLRGTNLIVAELGGAAIIRERRGEQ